MTQPQPIPPTDPQDALNRRVYHAPKVHKWYRADAGLDRAETMALLAYQPSFAGRDVLDIGAGTGRTTRFLAPHARSYVATDYSPAMVAYLQTRLPSIDARLADMRDLSAFADTSFDFVLASANVIDAVGHSGRLRTLGELRRVLRADGVLMFSSHNRGYCNATKGPWLERTRNPATQLVYAARFVRSVVNHTRVRRMRRAEDGYALLNDHGHDYATLHYYIDREHQRAQLALCGFSLADVFDSRGIRLSQHDVDSASPSLLYVARRLP